MKKRTKGLLVVVAAVAIVYAGVTVRSNNKITSEALVASAYQASTNIQLDSEGIPDFTRLEVGNMAIGFNNEDMLEWFGDDMVSQDIIDAIEDLDPEFLRFPGGTPANFYRYDRPGYGRNLAVDNSFDENHVYRFIDMVHRLGDPKVCVVLNLFEHFPNNLEDQGLVDDNMALLALLEENDIDFHDCIELGNEFYAKNEVVGWARWNLGQVASKTRRYLGLAEQYADRIKGVYPNAKVGVPVGDPADRAQLVWNAVILQEMSSDIDAIIPHLYVWIPDRCANATNVPCVQNAINQYLNRKGAELAFVQQELPSLETWVTEYNVAHHRQHASFAPAFAETPLYQEYTYRMLEMLEQTGVDIALRHRLVGLHTRTPYNTITLDKDTGEVTYPPLYEAFTNIPH